ncbi:MAG TPA: Uma2 family endonuclease, partial [Burkholderiales bacterium]|nr:Uma2 family endonuclease [Burkholderiales bacterium]
MGNLATPEALVARWIELCKDPSLLDLPYKIELNAWGKIEMSPASNRHGRLQMALGGIRVPGVVWASAQFMEAYGEITPYLRAPEICVEIVSPSNVQAEIDEKIGAYLAAGATEVWLVSEEG